MNIPVANNVNSLDIPSFSNLNDSLTNSTISSILNNNITYRI